MPMLSAITSPDQPLILIVSPDSGLRIDLARLIARLNALALVVLDLDVMAPVLAPYADISLAIIDDRSSTLNGLGVARALQERDADLPIILLREHVTGSIWLSDAAIVIRDVSDLSSLPGLFHVLTSRPMSVKTRATEAP